MSDLKNELANILVRELSKHYHFDINDPSMLLVKNPGTGNPLEQIVVEVSNKVSRLIEIIIKDEMISSYDKTTETDFQD